MQRRTNRTKKSSTAQNTGQLGVNLVEETVLKMRFVWNPIHFESGIDGQIEIVETGTGAATNRIIQVQVKATAVEFQSESQDALSFHCEREHIDYWLGGTAPVILVVCRPLTREAYWKDIKGYFTDPANQKSATVRFNKTTDKFTPAVAGLLANLAQPEGGTHLGPLPKTEKLVTNLFPIESFPETLWSGSSAHKGKEAFTEALKAMNSPHLRELLLSNSTVYSFHDLTSKPLSSLVEKGTVERNSSEDWALTDDPDLKRNFVQLLNRCLRQFCFDQHIGYDGQKDLHYFHSRVDRIKREIRCPSLQKDGRRSVAEWHASKLSEDGGYYRHQAFKGKFVRFGDKWFLEITPSYFFTTDGKTEHRNSEVLLAGIKRMERHRGVLGHLLLWKSVFSDLDLSKRYKMLKFSPPLELELKTGIDDEAWQKTGKAELETDDSEDRDDFEIDDDTDQLPLW